MFNFILICIVVFSLASISHYTNWFHYSNTSFIIGFVAGCLIIALNTVIDCYNCCSKGYMHDKEE